MAFTKSNSFLLDDEGKINLQPSDLFDRIINLKLYAGEDNELGYRDAFVIRSDWELYNPNTNKILTNETNSSKIKDFYIRKCVRKPSIKVQYKQISSGNAIEIDIFVSNFFIFTSDGKTLMSFNNLTNKLKRIEIQMGYWGQFANNKPTDMESFCTLVPQNGTEIISCNVNFVQTDKLPPDSTLHIHGYVGNCYGAPLNAVIETHITKEDFNVAQKKDNLFEEVLYRNITRKFIRKTASFKSDEDKININEKLGLMDSASAEKYGIKVICSEKLIEAGKLVEEQCKKTSADKTNKDDIVCMFDATSPINALNQIRTFTGLPILFKELKDGNFFAFLESEAGKAKELAKSLNVELQKSKTDNNPILSYWKNRLPAVYNITTDAICTIVCPFFFFIDPFNELIFSSRYALGGIVSYYANFNATESTFYALWMNVSFATVEDINECQIACTGR